MSEGKRAADESAAGCAEEIGLKQPPGSSCRLQIRSDKPQGDHVECNVQHTRIDEAVGDQLPDPAVEQQGGTKREMAEHHNAICGAANCMSSKRKKMATLASTS